MKFIVCECKQIQTIDPDFRTSETFDDLKTLESDPKAEILGCHQRIEKMIALMGFDLDSGQQIIEYKHIDTDQREHVDANKSGP